VLHYTGMRSADEAVQRLCDAQAQVSAHYVVDEEGRVTALVEETECAWHAGVSFWRGKRNVNQISIGVEIANPGHEWGYCAFPEVQMEAVAMLCRSILSRHKIAPRDVVGHSDVAPQRKEDPGELFNWRWLAQRGVGLWSEEGRGERNAGQKLRLGDNGEAVFTLQTQLAEYGYDVPQTAMFDEATQKTVIAFQRHFRQNNIAGQWDSECHAVLTALLCLARGDAPLYSG
jgi:N-acetylmuramoyl-L-alanine amidase